MRTADDELASWVHEQLVISLEQSLDILRTALLHPGDQDFLHVATNGLQHGGLVGKFVMLGGDYDAVNALGPVPLRVLHGDLRFGVGTQVGHLLALLADGGELLHETVGQLDGQRHVVVHFVAGVTEHHALVARTLLLQRRTLHALVDVGRLAVDGGDDTARFVVELVVTLGVADTLDGAARHIVNGDVPFGLHFAGADHKTGGHQRFARHFRLGVLREKSV